MGRRAENAGPPTALEREQGARRWLKAALGRLVPACDPSEASTAIFELQAARREGIKLVASLEREGLPSPGVAGALREQLLAAELDRVVAYADAAVDAER